MNYTLIGLAAYLIFGAILTHSVISSMHRRRGKLRDWAIGAVTMPVLFVVGLACMAFEKLWARLMKVLDLKPPEEMRAGPDSGPPAKTKTSEAP